jgi:hypothetical protein
MLPCNTITETLQTADFYEEFVMIESHFVMTMQRCEPRSAEQARGLPGD